MITNSMKAKLIITECTDAQVEGSARRFGSWNVRPFERIERADGTAFGSVGCCGQILTRFSQWRALIDEQWNVNAHYCKNATHVEVNHINSLKCERFDWIIHHFGKAECEHKDDEQFAVHWTQCNPQVSAVMCSNQVNDCCAICWVFC